MLKNLSDELKSQSKTSSSSSEVNQTNLQIQELKSLLESLKDDKKGGEKKFEDFAESMKQDGESSSKLRDNLNSLNVKKNCSSAANDAEKIPKKIRSRKK